MVPVRVPAVAAASKWYGVNEAPVAVPALAAAPARYVTEPPHTFITFGPAARISTELLAPVVSDVSTMLPLTTVAVAPLIAELSAVAQVLAVSQFAVI